jgi:hypothetical protein
MSATVEKKPEPTHTKDGRAREADAGPYPTKAYATYKVCWAKMFPDEPREYKVVKKENPEDPRLKECEAKYGVKNADYQQSVKEFRAKFPIAAEIHDENRPKNNSQGASEKKRAYDPILDKTIKELIAFEALGMVNDSAEAIDNLIRDRCRKIVKLCRKDITREEVGLTAAGAEATTVEAADA